MATTPKHASDLETNPIFIGDAPPDAPVTKGIEALTAEGGARLQLMARINNPVMLQALAIAHIYGTIYGSKYVRERMDEALRTSVSVHGLGRRDMIDVIEAGGALPAEYYTGQPKRGFKVVADSEE